jgi:hypothetical protein
VAFSLALFGFYNQVAFGNPVGPYTSGVVSLDVKKVGMIFLGLHLDGMQGMFMQQPLLLLGLVGIVPLIRAAPRFDRAERGPYQLVWRILLRGSFRVGRCLAVGVPALLCSKALMGSHEGAGLRSQCLCLSSASLVRNEVATARLVSVQPLPHKYIHRVACGRPIRWIARG